MSVKRRRVEPVDQLTGRIDRINQIAILSLINSEFGGINMLTTDNNVNPIRKRPEFCRDTKPSFAAHDDDVCVVWRGEGGDEFEEVHVFFEAPG